MEIGDQAMAIESPAAGTSSQQQQRPPGFFMFLKHGALFAPLLVLTIALAAALLLGNALSVQPLAAAVLLDADAMSRVDPATTVYRDLASALWSDLRRLLLAAGACLLGAVLAGSAIKIATVFAAVAAYTSSSSPSAATAACAAARGNVWGPILTIVFGYVVQLACAAGMVALAVLAVVLLEYSLQLLFLALLAALFVVYLNVVCAAQFSGAADVRRNQEGAPPLSPPRPLGRS